MKNMQKLQPKMVKIKEKYKDDPARMNQEVMSLYKTYKVNPLGGCLPMVLQIPIFFALYKVLLQCIELRHAPFMLWITDLVGPRPAVDRVRSPVSRRASRAHAADGRLDVPAAEIDADDGGPDPGQDHDVSARRFHLHVPQLRLRPRAVLVCQQPAGDSAAVYDQPDQQARA